MYCTEQALLLLLPSPATPLGGTILGESCAYVTVFNPTIEVATFRLRGWCMLGVFLLPAFARLGHECQDLWSLCDGMHVSTDQTRTHVYSKGKIPSTGKKSPQRIEPTMLASCRTASPTHYQRAIAAPTPDLRPQPTTLHQAGQRAQHITN